MENEFQKMQRLAGVPVTEVKSIKDKKQLDENFVGIGAINNPFPEREKTDYELAFDHYIGNINEAEGEEEMGAEEMGEENPIDAITMDVPLFIRMLEFAREDASTDMDLHDLAEKAIAMSAEGEVLSMDNYEDLVGGEAKEEELNEGEDHKFVITKTTGGKYGIAKVSKFDNRFGKHNRSFKTREEAEKFVNDQNKEN